ncbi:APC family permease [Silvibacterium dinghuense]|uniref:APC family permease n=1 Tax=Silvibacterium dinghuense TaxID=1560006 RepID=A0A4V1NW33_9BACT|nr:APC family permease [Silvibacterium dinghuense]RXS98022.1 APC family permease [Silvibacterium dinghuense]GGH03901.1 amino acid transporter [Silvibacterium dinghuense]
MHSSSEEADDTQRPALRRALRFRDLTLFYIVSGLSVRWVATAAAAGPSTLVVWIFALCGFFVPLAACVLELSSRYPAEGGLYVWTREAFGDFPAFLAAWTYWMSNLPYFPAVLYFGAGSVLFAFGAHGQTLTGDSRFYLLFALAWLVIITVTNIAGINAGKWLNNVSSLGSLLPISLLIALAVVSAARHGSATHFAGHALMPHLDLKNAIFWSTIFFAFGGCEAGSFMGEEIENPRRTIPRALLAGGAIFTVAYIAGTAALLVALPSSAVHGVDGFMRGMTTLCARLRVAWLAIPIALLIGLNAVGGAAAYLSSTSRLPFVAGIDHYLPRACGRVHPRFRTPWVAIGCYGLAGMAVAVLGQAGTTVRGAYDVLVSMSILSYFLPYLMLFAAMIRLQSRPAGPEVIRVWGGQRVAVVLATIGFLSTALTIVLSVIPGEDETHPALAVVKVIASTLVLVGAGVAVFLVAERKKKRTA